ncbi:uncharacterized protein LOC141641826 [Silene latifolia]|uniref:uncharacterized protein LOC141641826 n=1 Tax=Silene latifolia TaxID=37657 RepID=UPI003D7707B4
MKSNLYFGGVASQVKALIINTTGYVEGAFPVRYLGIPLFSSRLTQTHFQPLLDKIKDRISHWANHFLSYSGKIALINSIIFGLQNFWGMSVLLPKGIVKKINKICKDFLWGIEDGQRRLVFKSWDSFCLPRKEGGLSIKEILSWNKSHLMSWIRKIDIDFSTIWVKWMKAYVLQGVSIWDFQVTAAHSWGLHSIISCRDTLLHYAGTLENAKSIIRHADFKHQIYELLRPKGVPFLAHKTLGDSFYFPKHIVIGMLAAQNKLPTIDNLCKRGFMLINRCALCESQAESSAHLFFECVFSSSVWLLCFEWLKPPPSSQIIQYSLLVSSMQPWC